MLATHARAGKNMTAVFEFAAAKFLSNNFFKNHFVGASIGDQLFFWCCAHVAAERGAFRIVSAGGACQVVVDGVPTAGYVWIRAA